MTWSCTMKGPGKFHWVCKIFLSMTNQELSIKLPCDAQSNSCFEAFYKTIPQTNKWKTLLLVTLSGSYAGENARNRGSERNFWWFFNDQIKKGAYQRQSYVAIPAQGCLAGQSLSTRMTTTNDKDSDHNAGCYSCRVQKGTGNQVLGFRFLE